MSILDSCTIFTANPDETAHVGSSLALTLTQLPLTIDLVGEMGSGKTTFVQGLARGLGLHEHPVSPTFALERRYGDRLCHIDLCRLGKKDVTTFLRHSDDYPGVRVIEWANRSSGHDAEIRITFTDNRNTRIITCEFYDISIPSDDEIAAMMNDVRMPEHIRRHTETVAYICDQLAKHLLKRHRIVRPKALHAAALLHDLLRVVDVRSFDDGMYDTPPTDEQKKRWSTLKEQYATRHEPAAAEYLAERGYGALGEILIAHRGAASAATPLPGTSEQKLLCYADKRVDLDRVVTLKERFAGLIERHKKNATSREELAWQRYITALEQELFPDGPPL